MNKDIAFPLSFEPSGDGMPACVHDANGAIICEVKYSDFENDVTLPEQVVEMMVRAFNRKG